MSEQPGRPSACANPIKAPGTEESDWLAWEGWGMLPEAALPGAGRVVVVGAHPDDAVLGVGGTMALLARAGVPLTVVSVTDGEPSDPDGERVTPSPDGAAGTAVTEARQALAELGAGDADTRRLRVPDDRVPFHEDEIVAALAPLLSGAALCLAPWIGDVHGDHEAAGRAALAAAREASVPCRMYPVWMWHWARPGDPRVPWAAASCVRLSAEAAARKRAAVAGLAGRAGPPLPEYPGDAAVLPPGEVEHHLRDVELVFG